MLRLRKKRSLASVIDMIVGSNMTISITANSKYSYTVTVRGMVGETLLQYNYNSLEILPSAIVSQLYRVIQTREGYKHTHAAFYNACVNEPLTLKYRCINPDDEPTERTYVVYDSSELTEVIGTYNSQLIILYLPNGKKRLYPMDTSVFFVDNITYAEDNITYAFKQEFIKIATMVFEYNDIKLVDVAQPSLEAPETT